uniref:Uncharacterized protein n=1 Tax=Alexandrium catenella TaxID=2925 RepID=A0A7S1WSJ9_ALECA|mmetsp:Transcript_85525/g.227210  ORF Transcript_85525/g.227210 Transcript_85525/m.227210 type:complete len:135 (+) Transcript_85525:68-472(+)
MQGRKPILPALALAALACLAAWHAAGVAFANLRPATRAPAGAPPSAAAQYERVAERGSAVALRAEDDKPVRRGKYEEWQRPFPKYIVGATIFFAIVGYFGGGPILAVVFGVSGAGLGTLFEPFEMEDGSISGLD